MWTGINKILLFTILFAALSPAADLAADATYQKKCAGCHGSNGEGKSILLVRTTPLNAAATKSDAELTGIITNGIPKTKMKGFGEKLSAEEIQTLVSEIKALK